MNKIVRLEQKKTKRKADKECPWEYRGFVIQRQDRPYNYTWTAINKQGRDVLVDNKLKNLCLKIDRLGTGLTNMDKTARLEVAIYMLEERIKSLEGSLREIRNIALVSEGVEFYAMLADKALKEKNERDPQP